MINMLFSLEFQRRKVSFLNSKKKKKSSFFQTPQGRFLQLTIFQDKTHYFFILSMEVKGRHKQTQIEPKMTSSLIHIQST